MTDLISNVFIFVTEKSIFQKNKNNALLRLKKKTEKT